MEVAEAVQWWGQWQLRILVLGSLFLQYFLFAIAPLRKRRIPPWLSSFIWLAYVGSDAVAIYALATLFNHQKKREWVPTAKNNAALEALWAPILLLHLGGQDGIAAFSIEDNELWKRHVLTAASQVSAKIMRYVILRYNIMHGHQFVVLGTAARITNSLYVWTIC